MLQGGKLPVLVFCLQIGFIIIYAFFVTYDTGKTPVQDYYPMFQDVNVMIFTGFGLLMTFLKKYGYSAVGLNMLLAAISLQWAIIMRGLWDLKGRKIPINIISLINGNFASAAVLISLGAVLGKSSPLQLVVMAILEIALFACNEHLGVHVLNAVDIGGSIFIHTFGAYFGLAVSYALFRKEFVKHEKEGATSHSDIFAMIGTLFLWMLWPSFNSALAAGDEQHRSVLNTLLSLLASCVVTFAVSSLLNDRGRLSMVHIQNATLAGGVAIGSTSNLLLHPFGAMIVGSLAGILCTLGYKALTPFLAKKFHIHDTCGVNNLHGMSGILAGFVSAVVASMANETNYGPSLYRLYPSRAPLENSTDIQLLESTEPGKGWNEARQAYAQLAALAATFAIAIAGGLVTGILIRQPVFDPPKKHQLFDDGDYWEVADEDHP